MDDILNRNDQFTLEFNVHGLICLFLSRETECNLTLNTKTSIIFLYEDKLSRAKL